LAKMSDSERMNAFTMFYFGSSDVSSRAERPDSAAYCRTTLESGLKYRSCRAITAMKMVGGTRDTMSDWIWCVSNSNRPMLANLCRAKRHNQDIVTFSRVTKHNTLSFNS